MKIPKRIKFIYGWTEQNGASWGVESQTFDCVFSEDGIEIMSDGELLGPGVPSGRWFYSFATAKKVVVEHWKSELDIARRALSEVRRERKGGPR